MYVYVNSSYRLKCTDEPLFHLPGQGPMKLLGACQKQINTCTCSLDLFS